MRNPIKKPSCGVCGLPALAEIPRFDLLPRVTSDCVPYRPGGRLSLCAQCGTAQSPADDRWFSEIEEIYNGYNIYSSSKGVEQQVFDAVTGLMRGRSEVLLELLLALPGSAIGGKVLDVGCGTGGTLKAFAGRGAWELYGLDIDDRNLSRLQDIPGFHALYTCPCHDVPERFDIITLVHSLEHFAAPHATLTDLHSKLNPGGRIFLEVPNASENPFDYVVADHRTHFTPETLAYLMRHSGFSVQHLATDWVAKEISMVSRHYSYTDQSVCVPEPHSQTNVTKLVTWLSEFAAAALSSAAGSGSFGLFGTAISATWLWPAVCDRVQFFVDEDRNRVGRSYLGRPILSPKQTPAGAVVFLALVPALAASVKLRLRDLPIDFRLPPSMP
jgi:2-polyprenyl-3-methyl-5-hydroxy-6-metoxy-1,4-benzoquinol methylase